MRSTTEFPQSSQSVQSILLLFHLVQIVAEETNKATHLLTCSTRLTLSFADHFLWFTSLCSPSPIESNVSSWRSNYQNICTDFSLKAKARAYISFGVKFERHGHGFAGMKFDSSDAIDKLSSLGFQLWVERIRGLGSSGEIDKYRLSLFFMVQTGSNYAKLRDGALCFQHSEWKASCTHKRIDLNQWTCR